MADEQIPPDKESTLPDDQAEYDALVRKYGEAMLRIGQLESQVNSLTSRLDDRSTPGPGVIGAAPWLPSEYDGLVDRYGQAMLRVGRLESRMGDAFGPAEEGDLEEVDGAASNAWPPELNGLMGRIEAMEGRLGAPQGSRHRRSAAGLGRGSPGKLRTCPNETRN